MSRKPFPGVIQVQHMLATKTKCRKPARHARLLPLLGPIRPWHTNHLVTENTARQMSPAVGTADARVDAGREHGVARLHGGRRHNGRCVMMIGERSTGIAVDATEGDLARRRLERRNTVTLGALGGLNLELCPLEEEAMALKIGAICIAPCSAADVVNVSRSADGHDERGGLKIVKLFYIAGKDVHHGVGDASQTDSFNVSLPHSACDLLIQPGSKLVISEVAKRNISSVCKGQGRLVGYDGPVTSSYQG